MAGNVEADTTATIKVDTQLPTANMSQTGQGQPTITGTDQAALSGVASVSYRVGNSGGYTTVAGSSTTLNLPTGHVHGLALRDRQRRQPEHPGQLDRHGGCHRADDQQRGPRRRCAGDQLE